MLLGTFLKSNFTQRFTVNGKYTKNSFQLYEFSFLCGIQSMNRYETPF